MYTKGISILFIIVLYGFYTLLIAQESEIDTIKTQSELKSNMDSIPFSEWKPNTSVYLELGGKFFYSINVDYRGKQTRAFSLGLQFIEGGYIPSLMYFHFEGERHRFETGLGCSGIIDPVEGLKGMAFHGVLGFRYQKKKGLLFRAGFTPFYILSLTDEGRNMFVPFGGLSIGYSF